MNENDHNLVQFLWFGDIHKENASIVEYRFTRIVFGLTCSSLFLNATVRHHLKSNSQLSKKFVLIA